MRPRMRDHRRGVVAVVVVGKRVAVERAEQHRALAREHAGEMQLVQHPLDPVRRLADVLEEQDAAVDPRKVRRSREMRDHREVAAPQRALAREVGTVEHALDLAAVAAEHFPAMVERERGRRGGAEVVGRHRAREGRHPGMGECRQLERGEIAVPHPSLPGAGNRREVEPGEEPRPAVAAAGRHRQPDLGVGGHAHHGGEPLVVHRREALPARRARGIDDDLVAERREPRGGAVERIRLDDEAGGRIETDAVGAICHSEGRRRPLKKSDSSLPHSSASTPPSAVAW